jgi:hypothetical protein
MDTSPQSFTTSEAARRLGVSTKALGLYEQQGLVMPGRTWTALGCQAMATWRVWSIPVRTAT